MTNLSRVITFATGKGGTGKTSCAANVAGLAAQAGWRTLLIDLDSQANLGHDLGFSESEELTTALTWSTRSSPAEPLRRSW